ncbi:hypothetical protein [uncultured Enterococcus sp.]|uniref:hypothetical protein n=1 Tax=uncultured Enterococcus sp. TaxID=167972 RepID=UPI002596536E|nr:hypothetical protein [uncultured Enterococcus sp.]
METSIIILGASFGGVLVVFPPLTSKTFGMKNPGVNYGIMFFGYSIGALLGPQIAARFVDQTSVPFSLHCGPVVAIVGFVLSLVVRAMLKKAN